MTVLDAALGLLAAVLAWEWRVARQDARLALLGLKQALAGHAACSARLAAALRVGR